MPPYAAELLSLTANGGEPCSPPHERLLVHAIARAHAEKASIPFHLSTDDRRIQPREGNAAASLAKQGPVGSDGRHRNGGPGAGGGRDVQGRLAVDCDEQP